MDDGQGLSEEIHRLRNAVAPMLTTLTAVLLWNEGKGGGALPEDLHDLAERVCEDALREGRVPASRPTHSAKI